MPQHSIPPLYDSRSRVLILGSFPSVASRQQQFFYGHPQNRFWQVLSAVMEAPLPRTVEEKRTFLLTYRIAVWDVIASCIIEGSADSSIRQVKPNDLRPLLEEAEIRAIFVNGKTAEKYYNRYHRDVLGRQAICLPSTSPANAAWSLQRLIDAWRLVREALED